jgi:hypothetical protein
MVNTPPPPTAESVLTVVASHLGRDRPLWQRKIPAYLAGWPAPAFVILRRDLSIEVRLATQFGPIWAVVPPARVIAMLTRTSDFYDPAEPVRLVAVSPER